MTDKKPGEAERLDKPRLVLWPCDSGHAHLLVLRNDGSPAFELTMTVDEAVNVAMVLSMSAEAARMMQVNLPGIVGGDAGPCKPN